MYILFYKYVCVFVCLCVPPFVVDIQDIDSALFARENPNSYSEAMVLSQAALSSVLALATGRPALAMPATATGPLASLAGAARDRAMQCAVAWGGRATAALMPALGRVARGAGHGEAVGVVSRLLSVLTGAVVVLATLDAPSSPFGEPEVYDVIPRLGVVVECLAAIRLAPLLRGMHRDLVRACELNRPVAASSVEQYTAFAVQLVRSLVEANSAADVDGASEQQATLPVVGDVSGVAGEGGGVTGEGGVVAGAEGGDHGGDDHAAEGLFDALGIALPAMIATVDIA